MDNLPKKIREDRLWQTVYKLVSRVYNQIDEITDNFPNEEWTTASKLRNSANDSLYYVSLAVGNASPEAATYDLNSVRKNLFALQAMYIFATKQKFLALEPELIIEIDETLAQLDQKITASEAARRNKDEAELEPWMRKYQLWQKMQN